MSPRVFHALPVRSRYAVQFFCLPTAGAPRRVQTRYVPLRATYPEGDARRYAALYALDYDAAAIARLYGRGWAACPLCAAGTPCAAWEGVDLDGNQPRAPDVHDVLPLEPLVTEAVVWEVVTPTLRDACTALGLAWPCTRADVTRAHRALALRRHCFAGGFGDMVTINVARDVLREALDHEARHAGAD